MTRDPLQPVIRAGVYILLCYAPVFFLGWLFVFVFNFLAGSILAIFSFALVGNLLCLRIFEEKGLEAVGLPLNRPALFNALTGTALGLVAALLVVLPPLWTGYAHEIAIPGAQVNWREQMFVPLMLLLGAAGEEILFRGFGFQILMRAFGSWTAILPIGVLFALMHSNNPSASVLGIVNTAGFGILFGYAFLRSHDIWYPLGMHFGWNLTLLLLGANVSGIALRVTNYALSWAQPNLLWSGGDYGPEASLFTTFALIALSAAVWKVRIFRQHAILIDDPPPVGPSDLGVARDRLWSEK